MMKRNLIALTLLMLVIGVALAAFGLGRDVERVDPADTEVLDQPAVKGPQLVEISDGIFQYQKSLSTKAGAAEVMGDVFDPLRDEYLAGIDIDLFYSDGTPVDSTQSDANGKFNFAGLNLDDYLIVIDLPNYRPLNLYFTVESDALYQLPPAWMIPEPIVEAGDASGLVIDVLTGDSINDVNLEFKKGIDPPDTDPVVYTTTTVSAGVFRYAYEATGLPAGVYTVYATKAGYRDDKFHIYILGDRMVEPQNGTMSPIITGDDFRIVLTWGWTPTDLDSHLRAPDPFSTGRVHMYYIHSSTWGANPWAAYFNLDLDDTSSFGPETTTILQWEAENYCFYVHNYVAISGTSPAMSNSGATVAVLTATNTTFFYITPNSPGSEWGVFTIDGATKAITPLNTYAPITVDSQIGATCQPF